MSLPWTRLAQSPPRFFPWDEVRQAVDATDANLGSTPVEFAQELLGGCAHGCDSCGTTFERLTWVGIGTSAEAWAAGDEGCGWLTICTQCARQVEFLLDEELTQLRREGNW